MYAARKTRFSQVQPTATPVTVPASVNGINAVSSLMKMSPEDCIYTYNLVPVEYGLRLRKGYREWATGCIEEPPRGTGEVRTIIPFESNIQAVANDRLFAVTDEGIWNTTLFNTTTPTQMVGAAEGWTDVGTATNTAAGKGVWCEFTGDAAGDGVRGHYLFYADGLNGLWQYEESTDTWTRPPSGITATDWFYDDPTSPGTPLAFPVDDVAFVMVHKQRIWVILEDDDDAWYLPLASITGELKKFNFGSKMPRGGNLMGLWNWTIDGGDGVDDMLVAVSRGGDVIVYQGEDPEIISNGSNIGPWQTRGLWFIGEVPESRRIASDFGSDLLILSVYGLNSLAALMRGKTEGIYDVTSPSRPINRFLRADIENGKSINQWQLTRNPSDGFLQIVTPSPTNTPFVQYNMNVSTGAWGFWEGVPMTCGATWGGEYFMGAAVTHSPGVVFIYDGSFDGARIGGLEKFVANAIGGDVQWTQPTPATNSYDCSNPGGTPTEILMEDEDSDDLDTEDDVDIETEDSNLTPAVEAIGTIDIGFNPIVGLNYAVQYTVTTATGSPHGVSFGLSDTGTAPRNIGAGTFIEIITCNNASTIVSLIGESGFIGTVSDISIKVAPSAGVPLDFRTLTSFQAYGQHASFKLAGIARTIGVISGTVSLAVKPVFDYDIASPLPNPPALPNSGLSVWDSAVWDTSLWDTPLGGQSFPVGVSGIGRTVALAVTGSADTRINIVGWDLLLQEGGYL